MKIDTEFIKLDSFLKLTSLVESGGQAKQFILDGLVKVNGQIEIRRGKKLYKGDKIEIFDNEEIVE